MTSLENHFESYRQAIVGHDQYFDAPYGSKRIVYADWIASGRLYGPIEDRMVSTFGPFVGNTHSESSVTGTAMTRAYHKAHHLIKRHVNANHEDVIITCGAGMTGAVNKFQRLLGMRVPDLLKPHVHLDENERPVVFITHMEHHSNQTSWLETLAEVVCIPPGPDGLVEPAKLDAALADYQDRRVKVGSFTACSNVTGIGTPYHHLARIMHQHGGVCFVDFAASAPYCDIDMHPSDPAEKLDAIFFSPHKFLGGPGSAGVLIFCKDLYRNRVPDHPGGGTVNWTNPWGEHSFVNDIEAREDGGTPPFLQTIRAALAIRLKEEMGVDKMEQRERELLARAFPDLRSIPGLRILADHIEDRLGVISFYLEDIHYNLVVKLLNDRFGIQVRGGCSCAGTYGHYLLNVSPELSHEITSRIDEGDLSGKPGWVRLSLHPTMTDDELRFVLDAIRQVSVHASEWRRDYRYRGNSNEWCHESEDVSGNGGRAEPEPEESWFDLSVPATAS